jgi:predicted anti-sigma-YlaC factor YlaD
MTAPSPADLACRELVQVVTDYLEGALSGAERQRFEEHIATCRGCRVYLRQMRDLVLLSGRIAAETAAPRPPPELLRAFAAWKAQRA